MDKQFRREAEDPCKEIKQGLKSAVTNIMKYPNVTSALAYSDNILNLRNITEK